MTSASAVAIVAWLAVMRPEGGAGTVTLPKGEYDRLVERAAVPRPRPEPTPVSAGVGSVDVRVRVDGTSARASARLQGDVFAAGAVRVPIVSTAAVVDARLGEKPVALVRGEKEDSAILPGPAPFVLDLELALAVQVETGGAALTIPAFPAGVVRAEIEVPGNGADVSLTPGVLIRKTTRKGHTTIEATLWPHHPTRVAWTSREAVAAAPRESRWLSEVKTLVTLEEADLRLTSLVDVDVIQGEPARFDVDLPPGFELVDVSGPTLESTDTADGRLGLKVTSPATRHHQFLVLLERATMEGALQPPLVAVAGAQRETGEVAVEGVGTLELQATEEGTLRRIDVRELDAALRSLAQHPLLAGFRYHRRPSDPPRLRLEVRRFPDAAVLAAVAERATVTTLLTGQGRMLTEVALTVRNQGQPFLRVILPNGAQILSADIAGEKVKPVLGSDGVRVPLLRAGFRPAGPYPVSFVYVQSGAPLGKKGEARLALARVDVPIQVVEWEVFLPDRYKVQARGGNVLPAHEVLVPEVYRAAIDSLSIDGHEALTLMRLSPGVPRGGAIEGRVVDETRAPLPGATITVSNELTGEVRTTTAGADGRYLVSGLSPMRFTVKAELSSMKSTTVYAVDLSRSSARVDLTMALGTMSETIEVVATTPVLQTSSSYSGRIVSDDMAAARRAEEKAEEERRTTPSANVASLQRRVAGVLPVEVEVPRSGTSHRFVRPLVLDEETSVQFRYRMR